MIYLGLTIWLFAAGRETPAAYDARSGYSLGRSGQTRLFAVPSYQRMEQWQKTSVKVNKTLAPLFNNPPSVESQHRNPHHRGRDHYKKAHP